MKSTTGHKTNRETEAFYGTDADTFYLDSRGQTWLIQSVDGGVLPSKSTTYIPCDAVKLSDAILDDQQREDAENIEANYQPA